MSDEQQHRRPHPTPMAAPYLEFDITSELEQLHREAARQSGQNAKTLVKFDDLRIVLMALKARSRIPGHQTEGRRGIPVPYDACAIADQNRIRRTVQDANRDVLR